MEMAVPMVSLRVAGSIAVVWMPMLQWELMGRPRSLQCELSELSDSRTGSGWMRPVDIVKELEKRLNGAKSMEACKSDVHRAIRNREIKTNGRTGRELLCDEDSVGRWLLKQTDKIDDIADEINDDQQPGRPSPEEVRRRLQRGGRD